MREVGEGCMEEASPSECVLKPLGRDQWLSMAFEAEGTARVQRQEVQK